MKDFKEWLMEEASFRYFGEPNKVGKITILSDIPSSSGLYRNVKGLMDVSVNNVARMMAGQLGIDYPESLLPLPSSEIDWLSGPLSKTKEVGEAGLILSSRTDDERLKERLIDLGGNGSVKDELAKLAVSIRGKRSDKSSMNSPATHYFVNRRKQVVLLSSSGIDVGDKMASAVTGISNFRHPTLNPLTNFDVTSSAAPAPVIRRIVSGDIKYLPRFGTQLDPYKLHKRVQWAMSAIN